MSSFQPILNHIDLELSQFARALALPIRVFIIRTIIENGNSIDKQALPAGIFSAENINKHVHELKSAGILKITGNRGQITYSVDQHVSKQISYNLNRMFQTINQTSVQIKDFHEPFTEVTPESQNSGVRSDSLSFGQLIKRHRQELNISQEELARRVDMDRAHLSRVENGKKKLNASKLGSLSKALYVDFQMLIKEYYSYDSLYPFQTNSTVVPIITGPSTFGGRQLFSLSHLSEAGIHYQWKAIGIDGTNLNFDFASPDNNNPDLELNLPPGRYQLQCSILGGKYSSGVISAKNITVQ